MSAEFGASHSRDCTGGKLDRFGVLPVGLGSAARPAADGPIVTTDPRGPAGAATDFCSGLLPADGAGRDRGTGGYGRYGSARPINPGGRKSGPIHGIS